MSSILAIILARKNSKGLKKKILEKLWVKSLYTGQLKQL